MAARPEYAFDLFSDQGIRDPYPHYKAIRDLGPAVWLSASKVWAIGRHADLRAALADHDLFRSGQGVAANPTANRIGPGNLLASDPPLHEQLRAIVFRPLHPRSLAEIRPRIEASADALITRLLEKGRFDGMRDLAQFLPVSIVSELVGLPDVPANAMLRYAAAVFDMFGAENARTEAALPVVMEMRRIMAEQATRERVPKGGWIALLYDASEAGLVAPEQVQVMMRDYLGPALDTTIFATGHLLDQLARHPEQWQALRADPSMIGNAINEALRLESPIRCFSRVLARDHEMEGIALPEGARVLMLYASANRDERRWETPERFDIRRVVTDHAAFGHGIHQCPGMQLARLEMRALLAAMIARVDRIEPDGAPALAMNNVLRGFERLPLRFAA